MKAGLLASTLGSVYALAPDSELRVIERDADGHWRHWQSLGGGVKRVVHGGNVVAKLGLDNRVAAFQRTPPSAWFTWNLNAQDLCAARLPDGTPALFALAERMVWYTCKDTPEAPWRDWEPLYGPVTEIDAAAIAGGGLAVFGIREGVVYHKWQDRPNAGWKQWTALGAPPEGARSLEVTSLSGGGLVVFALAGDGALYHRWQDHPFGVWQSWYGLGGSVERFSVTKSPGGGLAVFAIGTDSRVWSRWQPKAFGEWTPWMDLQGHATSIAAQRSYADGLELFALAADKQVYHRWCMRLDLPWTEWTRLDYEPAPLWTTADVPISLPTRPAE